MDYYDLRSHALERPDDTASIITYAILALAEQVQGLRRDLSDGESQP